MQINNYTPTPNSFWTGRLDDENNRDAFRIHQIIKCINLNNIEHNSTEKGILDICILGFKSDAGVKRNLGRSGAELGPEYIRKELANLPVNFTKTTQIYDAGNIECINDNLEFAQAELRKAVKIILERNMFPIVIGGGHALAYGHYLGIRDYITQKENIGIINFDAHWDLRPYRDKGSSGTMFAQIADYCKESKHKFDYLCLGIQQSGNTINLFKRAQDIDAEHILAKDFNNPDHQSIVKKINDFINRNEHIYLTLCSDVFSSAFAPGVSAVQPFGMNPEIVLNYIKMIFDSKKVIGFDIAEVSPRFDQDNQTAKLAAIIIYAIINQLSAKVN